MTIKFRWVVFTAIFLMIGVTIYKYLNQPMGEMAEVQLTTIEQEKINFSDWQSEGKVIVVNFWATNCSTCKKEMPEMVKMYQQLKPKGLEYVSIAMQYDDPAYIKNYVKAQQLPFYVAWDNDGRLSKQFGNILGTPTTFIIDKQGKVIKRYVGPPAWDEFYLTLNQALAA